MDMNEKDYVVVVQCDIVKQRCSGYWCEHAFNEREDGFADYPPDKKYRTLYMTCGGCCGRAVHRKLSNLIKRAGKASDIPRVRIVVHLSSCICLASYHGPVCPHLDYLRELIARLGLDVVDGTHLSRRAVERREAGEY